MLLGLTIFVVAWICVGLMCVACCQRYSCKRQLGCCCSVLWLIGILHFVVAVSVAVFNPLAYNGCSYAR